MNMVNKLEIVFISDDKYTLPTGVAITSLKYNRNKDYLYNIYILCNNVSESNKEKFLILNEQNFNIILIDLNKNETFNNLEKSYSNVTSSSLYKFLIADILTTSKKIIYIDGDVIIQDDLITLYNVDLEGLYAGVVKDGPRNKILNGGKKHAFSKEKTYFNSGMMLLNLELLREKKVSKELIEYRLNEYNYFMDQDAFNVIFKEKVKYLSYYSNLLLHILTPIWKMNSDELIAEYYQIPKVNNKDEYFDKAKIIHFTFDKPWKYYDIAQAEKWYMYFKQSPFSDIKLYRSTYLNNYHNSSSYKIGKMITWFPKKIKKFLKN